MAKIIRWNIDLCRKWAEENTGCTVLSTEYVTSSKGKMQFTCEDCGGVMECTWNTFYSKGQRRCWDCGTRRTTGRPSKTHEQFIAELKAVHADKYTVLGQYINSYTKIKMQCNTCSNTWEPIPSSLLREKGCQHCGGNMLKTHEQFLADLKAVHADIFTVLGQYVNGRTKIKMQCNTCSNTWEPIPNVLLKGHGCPHCKQSKGELAIVGTLTALQLPYKTQYKIPECRYKAELPFDCAVLDSSDHSLLLLIEFDGEQHSDPESYYAQKSGFENIQRNDRIKTDYCCANNIPLLRIPYTEADNIEQIVTDKLYELNILQKATA